MWALMGLILLELPKSDSNYTHLFIIWRAKYLIIYYNGLIKAASHPNTSVAYHWSDSILLVLAFGGSCPRNVISPVLYPR
jgi:hypothetical protein